MSTSWPQMIHLPPQTDFWKNIISALVGAAVTLTITEPLKRAIAKRSEAEKARSALLAALAQIYVNAKSAVDNAATNGSNSPEIVVLNLRYLQEAIPTLESMITAAPPKVRNLVAVAQRVKSELTGLQPIDATAPPEIPQQLDAIRRILIALNNALRFGEISQKEFDVLLHRENAHMLLRLFGDISIPADETNLQLIAAAKHSEEVDRRGQEEVRAILDRQERRLS
jgi:hypothetical protein